MVLVPQVNNLQSSVVFVGCCLVGHCVLYLLAILLWLELLIQLLFGIEGGEKWVKKGAKWRLESTDLVSQIKQPMQC